MNGAAARIVAGRDAAECRSGFTFTPGSTRVIQMNADRAYRNAGRAGQ
jgi:hypothetical protein